MKLTLSKHLLKQSFLIRSALLAVVFMAGAGTASHAATTWQVSMGDDDQFHPPLLTVAEGDSVYWVNNDSDDHTSTSGMSNCVPDGIWDSGDVGAGLTYGRRFSAAGQFPYFCTHHCLSNGMTGTITVNQPVPTLDKSWGILKALYR